MPEIDPVLPSFVAAEAGPRKGAIAKDGPDSAPGCLFRVWGLTYPWNKDKCYKRVDQCLTSAWRELIGYGTDPVGPVCCRGSMLEPVTICCKARKGAGDQPRAEWRQLSAPASIKQVYRTRVSWAPLTFQAQVKSSWRRSWSNSKISALQHHPCLPHMIVPLLTRRRSMDIYVVEYHYGEVVSRQTTEPLTC